MNKFRAIPYLLAIAALLTAVLFLLSLLARGCEGSEPQPLSRPDSTLYWKNRAGQLVASLKGTEAQFSIKEKTLLDSLAKVYATRAKRVPEYVIIEIEGTTSLDPVDSSKAADYSAPAGDCPPVVRNLRQRFTSPYYSADVQIGDSSYLHLRSQDTVTVLWKRVKEGPVFNRRQYLQLNVTTANPFNRVAGLKAYRITDPRPKRWAIGLQAGYGISPMQKPLNPQPYFGIGLTRTLIRF